MTWLLPTPCSPTLLLHSSMFQPPCTSFISQMCFSASLHRAFAYAVYSPWNNPDFFSLPLLPFYFPSHPFIKYPYRFVYFPLLYLVLNYLSDLSFFVCSLKEFSVPPETVSYEKAQIMSDLDYHCIFIEFSATLICCGRE